MSKTGTNQRSGNEEAVSERSTLSKSRASSGHKNGSTNGVASGPMNVPASAKSKIPTNGRLKPARTPKRRTSTPRSATPVGSSANATSGSKKRAAATEFEETIKSEFGVSRQLQERLLGAIAEHSFTPHSAFAIKLALEEAMINAIKHGNKLDVSKHVYVKAKITGALAEFVIEDEGPGFERCAVPDPTLIENLEKCSGRGIMLIEAYMNSVEWSNRGRRLRMIKRNGEEAGG